MPESKDVLALLGDDELQAADLSRRLGIRLERLYVLLVSMEARGELQVIPFYDQGHRTSCAWRAA
ncbi:hypothetical protein [Variovorax boronicumulans]|uniref:hypothetical protein n=1 Tax=Variovorax boronicumulans TaxID=436515 RepID=UPI0012E53B77|nr:hypothetical protein [Variovorax boronicumulans]GER21281.1 hypothetical protein VCH24_63280 [Variovorax boronicumulans]